MSKRLNFILSGLTIFPLFQATLITKVSIAKSAVIIISRSEGVNASQNWKSYVDRGNKKFNEENPNKKQKEIYHELRILCWHKMSQHEENWKTEELVHENQFNYVLNKCGIECKFVVMPTWQT